MKITFFDPPKGWAHGFPKVMPEKCIGNEQATKWWLYENGYPFEMLDLALKHGRLWVEEKEENE